MIADRMGYYSGTRNTTLENFNLDTFNFYLNPRYIIGIRNISSIIPGDFTLKQNYPNPFNPATNIEFGLPKNTHVKIYIYDMLGKLVDMILDEELKAGSYKLDWSAKELTSGVYFYRLETPEFTQARKMVLLK
jgi:hypothetical protein